MNTFDELAQYPQELLKVEELQAVRLAELLEDHMKKLLEDHTNGYEHTSRERW
jgi:hypothetical protein